MRTRSSAWPATGESRSQADGLTLFLLDAHLRGLSIRTLPGFTGARLNELNFQSVTVPAGNVLGAVNHGWSDLEPVLDVAAAALCSWMVGGAERAFELSLDYSRARVQFGVPIGAFPRVQDHLIEIVNALDAARWTTHEALWKLDTQQPAGSAVSVAKIAASEAYHSVFNAAHEVHAAIGLTREYGLYLYTQAPRTFYDYLGGPHTTAGASPRCSGYQPATGCLPARRVDGDNTKVYAKGNENIRGSPILFERQGDRTS